ncbi:MAG: dTMP kinase [Candidatus Cloacimonetes bacterium]|nr:dTMP kinase [Candidatus Cloacimonadota bacterium]
MKHNGLFITFEGVEGCGKSTQVRLLADAIEAQGYTVLRTREPGGPPIAEKIRALLLDPANTEMLPETEALLYMASRAQHTGERILPALRRGQVVVCDRYYDSTLAYQGAARKLSERAIRAQITFATFGLVPAATILIDLPVEVGLGRIDPIRADRLEREDLAFHQRVRQGFLDVAKVEPQRYLVVDGQEKIEELHLRIKRHVYPLLQKMEL